MINYKLNNKNGHVNTNEFNIDERALYGTDIDKVHLIQLGKATNYYDDWRDHPNEYIRCALARRGYHSEYYLTDTINVRNAALYHLPKKMINYVGDDTATTTITRYLIGEVDPDTDLLDAFIQNSSDRIASIYGAHVLDAFILKLEAMNSVPNNMNKTMTEEQLRAINNPLWAKNYTILQISNIINPNAENQLSN